MNREYLVEVLVLKHGLTTEEAEQYLNNAQTTIQSAVEAFHKIIGFVKSAVEEIVEYFAEQEFYNPKPYWKPVLDTRLPNQVILNKPRYMVRKIIR